MASLEGPYKNLFKFKIVVYCMEIGDEVIALFDMDGVLCDYEKAMFEDLDKIRSKKEPKVVSRINDTAPQYLKNRAFLIRNSEEWWMNLPKFKLGWDVLKIAKKLGFKIVILSKSPSRIPSAYSGKKKWIENNLGKHIDVVILNRDKGIVYGRILVDDNPVFIKSWLKYRPRGLVIMPASNDNRSYGHPQVIRYDGKNLKEVREAMKKAKIRKVGK